MTETQDADNSPQYPTGQIPAFRLAMLIKDDCCNVYLTDPDTLANGVLLASVATICVSDVERRNRFMEFMTDCVLAHLKSLGLTTSE